MADDSLFVGLDVHKKTIVVATGREKPGESCRSGGPLPNTPDALRRLCQKLQADDASLYFCDEAGPCGYGVQRLLTGLGHRCPWGAVQIRIGALVVPVHAPSRTLMRHEAAHFVQFGGVLPQAETSHASFVTGRREP